MTDKMAKGRHVTIKGSRHINAKLSEEDVRAIRAAAGTLAEVAARYGIAFQTVSQIRRRKSWDWLP